MGQFEVHKPGQCPFVRQEIEGLVEYALECSVGEGWCDLDKQLVILQIRRSTAIYKQLAARMLLGAKANKFIVRLWPVDLTISS
ncbi:hypothetical protein P4S73_28965 [Paraglaciecola sp. Hal342]